MTIAEECDRLTGGIEETPQIWLHSIASDYTQQGENSAAIEEKETAKRRQLDRARRVSSVFAMREGELRS